MCSTFSLNYESHRRRGMKFTVFDFKPNQFETFDEITLTFKNENV